MEGDGRAVEEREGKGRGGEGMGGGRAGEVRGERRKEGRGEVVVWLACVLKCL